MTSSNRLSRRGLLQLSALGLAAAAGCTVDTGAQPSAAASAPGSAGAASSAAPAYRFPTDGVKMPNGNVSFRWLDSGDLKAKFLEPVIKAFGQQYPNIKTTYDGAGWDQVNQVVPLGIRNGSAPDVFALPQNVPTATAINEGWIRPLDDIIPGFDKWRAAFPDTALINGIHVFGNKVYSWPLNSTRRLDKMLFVNKQLASTAGVDPESIKSWDDFRAAAKKLTGAGKPGYLVTGDHLAPCLVYLANSAGWLGMSDGMNLKTGRYEFSSQPVYDAIELLRAMVADGSVIPGYLTLKDKDARAQFDTGIAGMMLNGPWDIPVWKSPYSITRCPSPGGKDYTIPFRETGANLSFVYAKSPIPEVCGVVQAYLGSLEGQTRMVELSGGNLQSLIPDANTKAQASLLDPNAKKASELARSLMRAAPQLEIRTPDASKVKLAIKPVEPAFATIMQGVFSGQVTDVKKALTELDSKLNASLDAAFASAGLDRSLTVFANWDPTKEYTKADYSALK